ncbi:MULTISPECIES: hypothetical protein [unclassified Bosea (in: a-proteobacteria)]|uniref:hypothetical protein n=1 Tax=unclassified Bosea (in: a-proteobacteria) TaxID=2653178 RepID=UPI000F7F0624|nr:MULTISPECIES: hypothetical protein [unclassified Bosea (in: a-proteobacteria)]
MDEARIEHVARALCRAARMDPDAMVDAEDDTPFFCSIAPAIAGKPAWHRFRPAAQTVCEARDFFSVGSPPQMRA